MAKKKKKKEKDYISIREYARRRGCSDTAVHKAWKDGHIKDNAFAWAKGKSRKLGIYPDIADKHWSKTLDPGKAKNAELAENILNRASGGAGADDPDPGPGASLPGNNKAGGPSTADAKRVESIYKAKLRELDYKKKSGELIEKEKVYSSLFAAGQELRDAMLSIPDRVIDEILSAGSRNDAHEILRRAIHSELERLTEIQKREVA